MKFVIECSELNRVLKIISPAIQRNVVLPILESFKIVKQNGDANVVATDLRLSIITKIKVDSKENFDVVLPFKALHNISLTNKGSVASFDVSKQGVVVSIDEKKFKLGGFEDPNNYPTINDTSTDAKPVEIGESILSRLVNSIVCVSSPDDLRFNDVGILIQNGKITIASTDAHRMFQYVEAVNQKQLKAKASVSTSFIKSISSLSDSELFVGEKHIKINNGSTTYIGTLTEQNTPFSLFEDILGTYKENCVVSKAVLDSVVNDILSYGTVLPFIDFLFEKDKIKIFFEDIDFDYDYDNVIEVSHSVEITQIRFNARQLKTLIDLCDEEEVRFSFPPEGNYTAKIANEDLSCKLAIQSLMLNPPA